MIDPVSAAERLAASAPDLHAIPLATITAELSAFAELWRHPDVHSALLLELAERAALHPLNLAASLSHLARQISPAPLTQLVRSELQVLEPYTPWANPESAVSSIWIPPTLTLHVLPANNPLLFFDAVAESLLVRSPTLLRTSAGDRTTPLLADQFSDCCPSLAPFVSTTHWPSDDTETTQHVAVNATNVVVWGSDNTIQAWKECSPPTTRIIPRGHRISITIIGPNQNGQTHSPSETRTLAAAIATDTALLDQRGCMSPHTLFVHTNSRPTLSELADELALHALPNIENSLPRGPLDTSIAAEVMQIRGASEFSGHARTGPTFTLVLHSTCALHHSPPARVLHLVPWTTVDDLTNALQPLSQHLSTAALHAPSPNREALTQSLARSGVRRICAPGRMQRPLLLRHHDGFQRLSPLVHHLDIEPQLLPAPLYP